MSSPPSLRLFPGAGEHPSGDAAHHFLCGSDHPFIRPTGRFDEATLEAVMRFQKEAGLPVTGTVDRQTWDAIMQALSGCPRPVIFAPVHFPLPPGSEVIQRGQSAPLLYPVQAMFCALADTMTGVLATLPTGVLDEGTAENLRWLQRNANLPETGEPGSGHLGDADTPV